MNMDMKITDILRVTLPALTVALLTGLSSCQQQRPSSAPEGAIIFGSPSVYISGNTRSTLISGELGDGASFGVFGYCLSNRIGTTGLDNLDPNSGATSWSGKESMCPPSVFFNQKVTVRAGGCDYTYSGSDNDGNQYRSWYRDGRGLDGNVNKNIHETDRFRYSFFAYYPYDNDTYDAAGFNVINLDSPDDFGAPSFRYTMPFSDGDVSTELDHMKTPDAMLAVLYNRYSSEGNLQFIFSHLLTALGVEVNNFSDHRLTIHSITLSGTFYRTMYVDLSGQNVRFTSPGTDVYKGHYVFLDQSDYPDAEGIVLEPVEDEFSATSWNIGPEDYLLLISGDGGSGGNYLGPNPDDLHMNISYSFDDGGENPRDASFTRPTSFTPSPGTRYTAQLNFVGDEFVLLFAVDNNGEWWLGNENDDDVIFE